MPQAPWYPPPQGHPRAIEGGQPAVGTEAGEQAVLQVDGGGADLLVGWQQVVIQQRDPQVLLQRDGACHLEQPGSEGAISPGDVPAWGLAPLGMGSGDP